MSENKFTKEQLELLKQEKLNKTILNEKALPLRQPPKTLTQQEKPKEDTKTTEKDK